MSLLHIILNQRMINNPKVGIMQGRLLPKYNGRYQAHPIGYWQNEFSIAAKYNLVCIEFIFDFEFYEKNPLMHSTGIDEIKRNIENYEVDVKSVCADYFMEKSFHHLDYNSVNDSKKVISRLIKNCSKLNIENIIIPCVDKSSLNDENDIERFIYNIDSIINVAEKYDINLCLETDLNPKVFSQLLHSLPSSKIKVNYDTGNSASLGYNVKEEFDSYGYKITDIHIKDRRLNGGSVILGEGDVDFKSFFQALKKINYNNLIIMQAFRDDQGIKVFEKQLNFFNNLHNKYMN